MKNLQNQSSFRLLLSLLSLSLVLLNVPQVIHIRLVVAIRYPLTISFQTTTASSRRRAAYSNNSAGSYMSITSNDPMISSNHHAIPNHVCIVGGGIIGTATAYYLATVHGIGCTIVDRTGTIAPAASGKAGGFLAYDWNDGTPTQQLTHRSFQLHNELAIAFQPESIQYRKLSCVAMNIASSSTSSSSSSSTKPSSRKLHNVEWASHDTIQNIRTLGTETTIAQVHPKLLCERLWYETKRCIPSCQLLPGKVVETIYKTITTTTTTTTTVMTTTNSNVTQHVVAGVQLEDGTIIDADAVLYACGPWNVLNTKTTGELQTSMRGTKYHSIIVPTKRIYTQCVFFHGLGDPEVYVRPDRTAYCTGYPEPARIVLEKPGEETIDDTKISTIYNVIQQVATGSITTSTTTKTSTLVANATILEDDDDDNGDNLQPGLLLDNKDGMIQQACYLPSTDDGLPIMGKLHHPNDKSGIVSSGLYIATGHSCWGILLGPGTGECMANLIATGQSTTPYVTNLDAFDPYRFI